MVINLLKIQDRPDAHEMYVNHMSIKNANTRDNFYLDLIG